MHQQTDPGREAAVRAAQHAHAAATVAGLVAGAAAEGDREVTRAVRGSADLVPASEVLEGVLEDAFERGADAWAVLRRRRPRWSRAAGSAVLGAAVAVAVTVLARRLATRDAPGAEDPEQVQAVVDLAPPSPGAAAAVPAGASVDEDGEAVLPA